VYSLQEKKNGTVPSSKLPIKRGRLNFKQAAYTKGEAMAALLGVDLALSFGCTELLIEGDFLVTILAINQLSLFTDLTFAPIISDIHLKLQHFHS
jgi:hypothetical protein